MANKPTTPPRPRDAALPAGSKPFIAEPQVAAGAGAHDVHGAPVEHTGPESISSSMDYAAHESMYHRFTGLVKWAIGLAILGLIFLFIMVHPMVGAAGS